ncbi:MAG: hypothetical protein IT518_14780 [Burkholderiales bacterium]|nr:hypothetical protein [Burkholderiales bacterium]
MAQLLELVQARDNVYLQQRMIAAVAVQAEVVRTEAGGTPNHAKRLLWAAQTFSDPPAMADRMIWAVLAQNRTATLRQILDATDAEVVAAVAAAVDVFTTP